MLAALPMLAASGAPAVAVGLALAGLVVSGRSGYALARGFAAWIAVSAVAAAALGIALGAWAWRVSVPQSPLQLLQLLGWFTWPAWALAAWTLWRWRTHLLHRHIAVPASAALVGVMTCLAIQGSDRALMLALPPLAVLAAFALPTLQRSVAAAIDWFSVAFFSVGAIAIWVIYASLQVGVPVRPAANVLKLAPGYPGGFSLISLCLAVAGTVAWLLLVRWRTGRHRSALWKSLVLPAGGLTLCWLLLLTLLLPVIDYARSLQPLVSRIALHVPPGACVLAREMPRAKLAAMEFHGGWRVVALDRSADLARLDPSCRHLVLATSARVPEASLQIEGWTLLARERRPTDRDERVAVYRRNPAAEAPR
jgi:hypothetical protein